MKLKKLILTSLIWAFIFLNWVFAYDLNFGDFLTIYFEWVSRGTDDLWNWWNNVDVKYTNVEKNSQLYKSLQKWIYLNYFPNVAMDLPLEKVLDQKTVANLLGTKIWKNFSYTKWEKVSTSWTVKIIKESLAETDLNEQIKNDVIDQLKDSYLYWDKVDWSKCNDIAWCINLLDDEYTEYIDSDNADDFVDQLEWNFEWIGAYLKIVQTWVYMISDTVKWWPAEKWGLKAWDIILKVDNHTITSKTTLAELVSYIKWKEWTKVKIQVKRWDKIQSFEITRWTIVLENISYQKLNWGACYMKIEQFNQDTLGQFEDWLKFFDDNNCKKYLFDVRDNPGWQLDVVANMLNHFVADWETIVELRFNGFIQDIIADNNVIKRNNDTIIFVNGITASASEIFAWVLADYLPSFRMIWSKTYWKWSAQSLVEYVDGSILKYTIAKRYTWKTKTNIDWKWFEPNVQMSDEKIESFLGKLGLK